MLTPNGCESSEDGCETLRSSKKRKNTDAQLLRFNKTLHRFGFSNETNQRNGPTKRTNETNQRENAHPNGCEKKCQLFENRPFCD
jgi:hypothetical protein